MYIHIWARAIIKGNNIDDVYSKLSICKNATLQEHQNTNYFHICDNYNKMFFYYFFLINVYYAAFTHFFPQPKFIGKSRFD